MIGPKWRIERKREEKKRKRKVFFIIIAPLSKHFRNYF